jgi:hypothetical protein
VVLGGPEAGPAKETEMWEEWRAEIDRSVCDGEVARDARARVHVAERRDEEQAAGTRVFTLETLRRGGEQTLRYLPRSWRMRLDATRTRPVL